MPEHEDSLFSVCIEDERGRNRSTPRRIEFIDEIFILLDVSNIDLKLNVLADKEREDFRIDLVGIIYADGGNVHTGIPIIVVKLPDLVKLYNDYQNAGVDFAAISVDYPDEVGSKILPFLIGQHVPFTVYVANVKKDEDFINELNPSWSGAVPATFIFDASGKQRVFMFGQKTLKAFKSEIDSVLNSR